MSFQSMTCHIELANKSSLLGRLGADYQLGSIWEGGQRIEVNSSHTDMHPLPCQTNNPSFVKRRRGRDIPFPEKPVGAVLG